MVAFTGIDSQQGIGRAPPNHCGQNRHCTYRAPPTVVNDSRSNNDETDNEAQCAIGFTYIPNHHTSPLFHDLTI
jgi:hypothetical protein